MAHPATLRVAEGEGASPPASLDRFTDIGTASAKDAASASLQCPVGDGSDADEQGDCRKTTWTIDFRGRRRTPTPTATATYTDTKNAERRRGICPERGAYKGSHSSNHFYHCGLPYLGSSR